MPLSLQNSIRNWFRLIVSGTFLYSLPGSPLIGGVVLEDFHLDSTNYEITKVEGMDGLSRFPICGDFDDQGNLYIAESSGSNAPVQEQLLNRPHSILRFSDRDGDGHFEAGKVFADQMMFPEGLLWHEGSVYVAAPPSIWKLTDTDNDGVADERVEWFKGKTLTGCANDLHGPYLGPDGLLYWCKGAFAEQTYTLEAGTKWTTRAAHIFRAPLDLSFIEPVMTGGMDNPVEVAFTPVGERVFTTTFFQHPGGGHRDGLIHAIYGGVYGKQHDVIVGHPRTGDLMPVMTHLGPSAPCGLLRYESDHLNPGYRDQLFVTSFNLHKVTRHEMTWDGARMITKDHDFLTCNNADFHPTDIIQDADGSLLIIDTGGWYKICCPTSQLYKPEITGGVYRIKNPAHKSIDDPRGQKIQWDEADAGVLVELLKDNRKAVRDKAIAVLAKRHMGSIPLFTDILKTSTSTVQRLNTVWTLTRMAVPEAYPGLVIALSDPSEKVRHAALHGTGLRRVQSALPTLINILETAPPQLQRVAAEALGRLGNPKAIASLLKATLSTPHDRVLEHSLIFALIEINDPQATRSAMTALNGNIPTRAGLIALDQMRTQTLQAHEIAPRLNHPDLKMRDTAFDISKRHPEWADSLFAWFPEQFALKAENATHLTPVSELVTAYIENETLQDLVAGMALEETTPLASRLMLLNVMTSVNTNPIPDSWVKAAGALISHSQTDLVTAAIDFFARHKASLTPMDSLVPAMEEVFAKEALDDWIRLSVLECLSTFRKELTENEFHWLITRLTGDYKVVVKSRSARILSETRLSESQQSSLANRLHRVAPIDFPQVLKAISEGGREAVGLAFLRVIDDHNLTGYLSTAGLETFLKPFPNRIHQEARPLFRILEQAKEQRSQTLETLMATMPEGDVTRGQHLYNSEQAACMACHEIGYLGGDLGPDLTRIGQVRSERDLLEAILYPSASFVRSYEPVDIFTADGEVYSGIVKNESLSTLTLAIGPGVTVEIEKQTIDRMNPGEFSTMPSGLDQVLSKQDLADLVAFLKANK